MSDVDDLDVEVDPALGARLRRALREVAATIDDDAKVVQLVTSPAPPDRRRHRWAVPAAAAIAGLAAGGGLVTLVDRQDPAGRLASLPTQPPPPTAEDLERAQLCVDVLQQSDSAISDAAMPPLDSPHTDVVVIEASGSAVVTIVADPMYQFACGPGGLLFAGSPDDVAHVASAPPVRILGAEGTSVDVDAGPGTALIVGSADDSVDSLEIALSDGSTPSAVLSQGWFVFDIEFGPDAEPPSDDELLRWTLADGTTGSTRLDLADTPTDAENCAMVAGCVEQTLAVLLAEADGLETRAQHDALADGVVSSDELAASKQDWVDCLNAAGMNVELGPDGDGYRTSPAGLDPSEQQQAYAGCESLYPDLVERAWELLDAQRRVEGG